MQLERLWNTVFRLETYNIARANGDHFRLLPDIRFLLHAGGL